MLFYVDGQYSKMEVEIGTTRKIADLFKRRFSGFNVPEKSKHRKRTLGNLSESKLESHAVSLREAIQSQIYLDEVPWAEVKLAVLEVVEMVEQFCVTLRTSRKRNKVSRETPRSEVETRTKTTILPANKGKLHNALIELERQVKQAEPYTPVSIREYLPMCDRRRVFEMIELLRECGLRLAEKCFHYVHHEGGTKSSLHFVWKGLDGDGVGRTVDLCTKVIAKIESEVPIYERRITKQNFIKAFGFVADSVALRAIFSQLTRDNSAPVNLNSQEIDERFKFAMLSEDAGIMVDLRHQGPENRPDTFREFFEATEKYLAEDIGVACQERRHGEQLYLAKAVSLKDLHQRVKERVPADTNIPSVKWLRYQFQPINLQANTAKYYKGRMNIKMMVQKRQIRVNHVDAHYCAAAWRYMREMAILHREITTLVSADDKHKIKVGEPSYPLAAAERGKQVIVGPNQVMAVGDHDFSKCTITPSVNFIIDIPTSINSSFYRGKVHIGFKDSIFKPSSALRHAAELAEILKTRGEGTYPTPVLLIYTDGGPDHRCTYMSVKLAMIALFLELTLDVLIALRTAPSNSWANPVERIMSIVNTGLQGVGMMRRKMSDDFESAIAGAGSVKEMREKLPSEELKVELEESLAFPIDILKNQMARLALKEKPFQSFDPASEATIDALWQQCLTVDGMLQRNDTTAKGVKNCDRLKAFMEHCCIEGHYTFQVKKCGADDCDICRPLRDERSKEVGNLPFPVLAGDGHYRPFVDVYKTVTKENRPSKETRTKTARKAIPFSPSVQHVRNADVMVQCSECDKWRLVFAKKKLQPAKKRQLEEILEDVEFTCGVLFREFKICKPF
ncbi:uncharacterized protein LOC135499336 [Lineus longissimus]|uniref:uncharacterized protein LOC135499336 n=1 Tax=Lineus longissimus TaxID=88925 RepID=UPI00315D07BE